MTGQPTIENIDSPFKLYCSKAAYNNNPLQLNIEQIVFMEWPKNP